MQYTSIVSLLFGALAVASPLQRRDSATVFTNLATIQTDIATLSTEAAALTGTLTQCLAIYASVSALESAESTTVTNTKATTWTVADSRTAATTLASITTNFVTLLTNFDGKYDVLNAAGYASFVGSFLSILQTDTDAVYTQFWNSLAANTTDVTALKTKLDTAFAATLAIY